MGCPLPPPWPISTRVASFLRLPPRERAPSKVPTDSFLPAASDWPPGMTSISHGARSQYSRAVTGVVAAAFGTIRDVPVTTVSHYDAVAARIGNGAVATSRRECSAGPFEESAQFVPLSTTRWPFLRCIPSAGVRRCLAVHSVCIGIRFRTIQPVVSRYTDCATSANFSVEWGSSCTSKAEEALCWITPK